MVTYQAHDSCCFLGVAGSCLAFAARDPLLTAYLNQAGACSQESCRDHPTFCQPQTYCASRFFGCSVWAGVAEPRFLGCFSGSNNITNGSLTSKVRPSFACSQALGHCRPIVSGSKSADSCSASARLHLLSLPSKRGASW